MTEKLYVGSSGITLQTEQCDLGHGVILRKTYANLFSPWMMAFAPAPKRKPHPTPWRAAKGGNSFHINVELELSTDVSGLWASNIDKLESFLTLLRLTCAPTLVAPVKLNMSFESAAAEENPLIEPHEVDPVIFNSESNETIIDSQNIDWFRENWVDVAKLIKANPLMQAAIDVCDESRVRRRSSHSMLAIWGALEHLFSPSKNELRHRVASNIATYLESRGQHRLDMYKEILKLYDQRSNAAHTTSKVETKFLIDSWVLLRNVLMKMILERKIPSQFDFEKALFVE